MVKIHRSVAVEVLPRPIRVTGERTEPMSSATTVTMITVHIATE
jgi:hypothetical protein